MAFSSGLPQLRGGLEASIQGFSTSIGPVLLFMGMFGAQGLAAGLWATLVTASVIHIAYMGMRSHPSLLPSSRVASLAAYVALVLYLAQATPDPTHSGRFVSLQQFHAGLLAASALYLLASAAVLASGLLRLGKVFKMIPTPVTSGVSNGTALLLVWLALQSMLHGTASAVIGLAMLAVFVLWPRLQRAWVPLHYLSAALVSTALGVALTLAFEPMQPSVPLSIEMLSNSPPVAALHWGGLFQPEGLRLLLLGLPGALTLALIMVLETFTCVGVMETRYNLKVDANRELLALGGSNLLSAALGGVPFTGSPVRSVANREAGGSTPLAGMVCMVVTTVLVLTLGRWLMVLPAGMVAGFFLMQAILVADHRMLARLRRLLPARRRNARSRSLDHAFWLSLCIALVAFFGNLIWACFLGLGLSCLVVLRRLSGRLTARWAYLDHYRSHRMRSATDNEALSSLPQGVAVLRLGGHLFFGNSPRLLELSDELHADARAVVIDVGQVADVDPSAVDALHWLLKALVARGMLTVLSGLERARPPELRAAFQGFAGVQTSQDLDRGLELCEDALLAELGLTHRTDQSRPAAANQLLQGLTEQELTAVLLQGEEREVPRGQALFLRDTPADGVWLLQSGRVSILFNQDPGASRLATFGPGQFVGEMGFVDGKTRSATAMADTPVRALLIDNRAFQTLREQQPTAVIQITTNIARELSQRVRHASALAASQGRDDSADWESSQLSASSRF